MGEKDTPETYDCEHCGSVFVSLYSWEVHTLVECEQTPQNHKEWINGGKLEV